MTDTLDKLKTIQTHLVKELTGGLKAAELREGEDMMGIASAQIVDSDGDIILIDGIKFDKYHKPPQRHLKLLASHMGSLPDGTPPIIGRIERFWKTTVEADGQEVPALAFAFSFAKDEDGQLVPLAAAYKKLMPKYLDSFSVGLMVDDYEVNKDKTGLIVKESSLFEISAVAIPANAEANALKTIKSVFKEQNIDLTEEEEKEVCDCGEENCDCAKNIENEEKTQQNTEIVPEVEEENKELEEETNTNTDYNEAVKTVVTPMFEELHKRLDSIESTLAIVSKGLNDQTEGPKVRSVEEKKSLDQIKQALDKIKGLKTN